MCNSVLAAALYGQLSLGHQRHKDVKAHYGKMGGDSGHHYRDGRRCGAVVLVSHTHMHPLLDACTLKIAWVAASTVWCTLGGPVPATCSPDQNKRYIYVIYCDECAVMT